MRLSSERARRAMRRLTPAGLVLTVYAAASWAVLLPFGVLDPSRLPVSASQDVGQQVWWLALALHDIVNGHWSFFTSAIDHPSGLNLLDNGSMPLLGLLMAPVTATAGPVASYLLLLRLGHLLSACSAYWVARRLGFGRTAALAAGLVYAFGPAMGPPTAQHAFLVFVPLPPLMLYLILRELRQQVELQPSPGRHPFRTGLLLGLLASIQYLISPEMLVSSLLLTVCVAALTTLWKLLRRRPASLPLRAAGRLAAGAAASGVPLLAYPVLYTLLGRAHVSGPVQLTGQPGVPIVSILLPGTTSGDPPGGQVLAALWHGWTVGRGLWPSVNVGYLGPLALIAVVAAVLCRRDPRVRLISLFAVITLVLELGPRLMVPGHTLAVRLPFALLYRVPVLQDLEPTRLPVLLDLAVGMLLAAGVDRLIRALHGRFAFNVRAVGRSLAAAAGLAAAGVALALAAPATGLTVHAAAPTRSTARAIGRLIPAGSVVLADPYPSFNHEPSMLLQAQAGLGFDLLGGYGIRADGPLRHATKTPLLNEPTVIAHLLQGHGSGAQITQAAAAALPHWTKSAGVTVVLVQPTNQAGRTLAAAARQAFGRPREIGGWLLWQT
jgi:hypothetical protein